MQLLTHEGIKRAARSLKTAFVTPTNIDAREDMCIASLIGGLALANAKLGAVHGFAGPLGGKFNLIPYQIIRLFISCSTWSVVRNSSSLCRRG